MVEYRVRFVVYDVIDMVVEAPAGTSLSRVAAMAVSQAEHEQPLVAWQVDEDSVTVNQL